MNTESVFVRNVFSLVVFALLCVSLLCIPATFAAFNVSEYEYVSTITVSCTEYRGYVRFELPKELQSMPNPRVYSIPQVSLSRENTYLDDQPNWFVKQLSGVSLSDIEALTDGSYYSALTIQGKEVTLPFENPSSSTVSRIIIDVKDSQITGATVLQNGVVLPSTLRKNAFHYEIDLQQPVVDDALTIRLQFDSVLKVREVSFYNQVTTGSKQYGYLYVDNNCNNTFSMYFGTYGEHNAGTGAFPLPVIFNTQVTTRLNPSSVADFDADSIINQQDNCRNIANLNQKDINYNGIGDACEDRDGDGIMDYVDNCVQSWNGDQSDADGDTIGDVCDASDDRLFEKNKSLVYVLAGFIVAIFLVIAYKLLSSK